NVLQAEGVSAAFYSAAGGLFASADGRIVDRTGEAIAGATNWGSDLVSLDTACAPPRAVLASGTGYALDRDQIQAYEIIDSQPFARGEPMVLHGPVTALWPSINPGEATVVVQNSKTGDYEASRLGVSCAQ